MASKLLAAFEELPLKRVYALVGALLTAVWAVVLFLPPLLSPFLAKVSMAMAALGTVAFAVAVVAGLTHWMGNKRLRNT